MVSNYLSIALQFFHNTSYLVQKHNAGSKKESVPGSNYTLLNLKSFYVNIMRKGRITGSF